MLCVSWLHSTSLNFSLHVFGCINIIFDVCVCVHTICNNLSKGHGNMSRSENSQNKSCFVLFPGIRAIPIFHLPVAVCYFLEHLFGSAQTFLCVRVEMCFINSNIVPVVSEDLHTKGHRCSHEPSAHAACRWIVLVSIVQLYTKLLQILR